MCGNGLLPAPRHGGRGGRREAAGGGAIERLGTAASRAGSEAYRLDGIDGMMEPTGYGGTMDALDIRHERRGELQKIAGNHFRYILGRY